IDFLFYRHYTPSQRRRGWFEQQERLLAFVLVPGRDPVLVPLGPAAPLRQLVRDWRAALLGRSPGAQLDVLGHKLHDRLWQPLRPHLRSINTVLIAPDGELCQLPFAAMPGASKGSYLLEEYALGYVISGRHLLELQSDTQRPASTGLLAIGGLNYNS